MYASRVHLLVKFFIKSFLFSLLNPAPCQLANFVSSFALICGAGALVLQMFLFLSAFGLVPGIQVERCGPIVICQSGIQLRIAPMQRPERQ